MDGAAVCFVGAEVNVGRRGDGLITVAADGLVVDKRARRDYESRAAAEDGAADAQAGPKRAGTVVAADGLVMAERAAGDRESGGIVDGAAAACVVAAGMRHVEGELTVGDAGGA